MAKNWDRKPNGTVSDGPGADLGAGERGTQLAAAVKISRMPRLSAFTTIRDMRYRYP